MKSLCAAVRHSLLVHSIEISSLCARWTIEQCSHCAYLAHLLHVNALQGVVQQWLAKYQDTAVEYAQQGYDQIQEYVRSNFNDYVEANNLTQVVH